MEDDTDLRILYRHLNGLIANQQYKDLSEEFKQINVEEKTDLELVATLRYSCQRWYKIPEWKPLRDRTKIELENRGRDAVRMLRGLEDENLHGEEDRPDYAIAFERQFLGWFD